MSFTLMDLFSGAGGMALGFHAAGLKCVGAVEMDQAAADTFSRTFSGDAPLVMGGPEEGDVNRLPVDRLLSELPESPNVVIGGPPCQGFSRIGRAKHASLLEREERIRLGGVRDKDRNLLYLYFLSVVRASRPLAFVMENVPGMREHLGADLAKRISREASFLGYNVRCFLLDAVNYGVPQRRRRIFFVGLRGDLGHDAVPRPPIQTHVDPEALVSDRVPEDPWLVTGRDLPVVDNPRPLVTVRDAIGDLPKLKSHLNGKPPVDEPLRLRREPSAFVRSLREWPRLQAYDLVSGNWYRSNPRDFPIFREMAQGDLYPEALEIANARFRKAVAEAVRPPDAGSDEWLDWRARFVPPYRSDAFHDKWRKLRADEPAPTLTAHLSKDTYSHIHYDSRQARTISVREAARLQSFPDAVEFQGNFGDQFRQIGNAVPPLLARALAETLVAQLLELGAGK